MHAGVTCLQEIILLNKSPHGMEFLSATIDDLIGNFIHISKPVTMMDRNVARITGAWFADNGYDGGLSFAQHRDCSRLLEI